MRQGPVFELASCRQGSCVAGRDCNRKQGAQLIPLDAFRNLSVRWQSMEFVNESIVTWDKLIFRANLQDGIGHIVNRFL